MKYIAYTIAIFIDILQLGLFLLFWALEPFTAVSGPIGTGLDMVLSVAAGFVLMPLLWADSAFYPGMVAVAFVGEEIPILDAIIPFWTILIWRCYAKKNADEKALAAKEQEVIVVNAQSMQAPPQAFDGIRAANDNKSSYAQAA